MFLALGIVVVVYLVVSSVVVMTLSLSAMDANQGHVLSEAGRQILGRVGFVVIGVAALLATASGVNATMYGDANLAYWSQGLSVSRLSLIDPTTLITQVVTHARVDGRLIRVTWDSGASLSVLSRPAAARAGVTVANEGVVSGGVSYGVYGKGLENFLAPFASFMVGDRASDIAAGHAASCRTLFIDLDYAEPKPRNAHHVAASLGAAADIIVSHGRP